MKILISILFFLGVAYAQEVEQKDGLDVLDFFKDKTDIPDPLLLRDPFKPPLIKGEKARGQVTSGAIRDGVFTNSLVPEDLVPRNIAITGVYIGENRRALAQAGGSSFLLKEGMKLNRGSAEVKAILPGGVVIVEKITNIYNQIEYLETIIPISE